MHRRENIESAVRRRDTKAVWNLIEPAFRKRSPGSERISPDDWMNHFDKTLNHKSVIRPEWNIQSELLPDVPVLDDPITVGEVHKALLSIKSGKAPGKDGISGVALKTAADLIAPLLTKVFNKVFDSGVFPPLSARSTRAPATRTTQTIIGV